MASVTEKRAILTKEIVDKIEQILIDAGLDPFKTGDTYNQFSMEFEPLEEDGEPVYGSLKFTLHKSNWDWHKESEKYEMYMEERELKAKAKVERDKKALADKVKREAKAAAKAANDAMQEQRRKEQLEADRAKYGDSEE